MYEDIEKIKYRNFRSKLYELKRDLDSLLDKDNQLNNNMKEIIMIDDKLLEEESVKCIFSNDININNELENRIIPSVNGKC